MYAVRYSQQDSLRKFKGKMTRIEPIEFNVKFITPLLIHGANSSAADTIGLTGKALRGCWRFWFRALVGGMVQDITKEKLLDLEGKLFGSSDEKVGATFRMFIETLCKSSDSTKMEFSARTVYFKGYKEGSSFSVRIIPRSNMSKDDVDILSATIWLWANLGGIGQRARRGFGSPVIYMDNNNRLHEERFEKLGLPIKRSFETDTELKKYIKKGVEHVWDKMFKWCKNNNSLKFNPLIYDSGSKPPSNPSFFIVSSLKQITIADKGLGNVAQKALQKIHGNSSCPELGTAIPKRNASPIFVRLHKVKDAYYPVVTWSTPKSQGCGRDYIFNDCNCKHYLDGSNV